MKCLKLVGSVVWVLALSGPAAAAVQGAGEYTDCVPSSPQVTFEPGYAVSLCFEYERDGGADQADAIDFGLGSRQSGLLWFFDPDNAEVLIKVLDGCEVNGHRWVFVAPVTMLAFNLSVEETATGKRWMHRNPRGGVTAEARSDLTAFPCGPAAASSTSLKWPGASFAAASPGPMADIRHAVAGATANVAGATAHCEPRPVTTLGGFTVSMCVEYERAGESVAAEVRDYGLDSSQSALLYFFERDNAEVLVKVLDGCAVNGHRWVFVAPVTTLGFNLSIEPPGGGAAWTHTNSLGLTASARSDAEAFPCADDEQPGGPNSFTGQVVGHRGARPDVEVLLTAKGVLRVATPDSFGRFRFDGLAAGEYAVKVHAGGHRTTPARMVDVPQRGGPLERFDLTPVPTDPFVFHWEEDQSTAGTEYSAAVNRPHEIEFEDEPVRVADNSSANVLAHDYNMLLVDSDEASWSQEHAWRLLTTMRSIPQETRDPYHAQSLPASQWLLTPRHVEGDIEIKTDGPSPVVLISETAFVNANPRVATVDGKRGIWFSKRLHHALVRYVTDNGRDVDAYERIFEERFGVTTEIRDYASLTRWTTGEGAGRFQRFHPEEIVTLLNMLEEFPSGMHKTQGLTHLVRRLDGTPNPLRPGAPAIAWTGAGYIEFMDIAFLRFDLDDIHRLVIHEKAHFLWAHVFDQRTRDDWARVGRWYEDPAQPSGWSTTSTTEFVSAYAHAHNPNEDMAESIAYFIIAPDKLRSRSVAKYEFVRDRIMQGNLYLSQFREDLTFQVYNLFPDYVFPGRVRRIDVEVTGGARDDKEIRVEIELHALDRDLEGAAWAATRVFSSVGTYFDLFLQPVDGNGRRVELGTVLVGTVRLSRYSKAGYWTAGQLKIADRVGNERYQRGDDFGWKLYVDNFLEDWVPPEYVPGTARFERGRERVVEGRVVQSIEATWEVRENNLMRKSWPCHASINDEILSTYARGEGGAFEPARNLCRVNFPMPDYMPSSMYSLNYVRMVDRASNWGGARFTSEPEDEEPQWIRVRTANPDTEPPELDLNRMSVDAEPTNPVQPNGETIVRFTFRVRDNISGYMDGGIVLRDPQGISHFVYVRYVDRHRVFPRGDPTKWEELTVVHVLPPGSAPGTWGVANMRLADRAHNFVHHDFTEVIHFVVD
ncbi:MAG: hypothetical protein F4112_11670 [Holophagales bacterium]|nr:hypothetical protein [Holophagales bacterium]MYD20720.1 hypothetical protein [Holophagales bacterium]MYI33613.1 hypothetical protein [Holophagales bacterium]